MAKNSGGNLLPLKASLEAIELSSVISCGERLTDKDPLFWFKFSMLVVPGMGTTSDPWFKSHANAS